ncbi:MAG: tetratricopeptide repeat protein [Paludibacteraceae bacterium]|nr:tetratricopeptide repeat protein [Paludibacteraceae bacterium]
MRKIFVISLTLLCLINCLTQTPQTPREEKMASILDINKAISNQDPSHKQMLDDFIARYGLTSDALTLQAIALEHQNLIPEAARKLDEAIATHTTDDAIDLSTLYSFRIAYCDNVDDKLKYAELSVKANPKSYGIYIKRAEIYQMIGKYDDAIKDIKKAVKLSNGDTEVRLRLAKLYFMTSDTKKGDKEVNSILKKFPDNPGAHGLRALFEYTQGKYKEFVDDYLYYLQFSKDPNLQIINEIAEFEYDYIMEIAKRILEKSITQEDIAYWNYFVGDIKTVTENDEEGAIKNFEKALALTKDSDEFRGHILAHLLRHHNNVRNYAKALEIIEEIEKIVNRNNNQPADWILLSKSMILKTFERYDEASSCLDQLIDGNKSRQETDSNTLAYYYYLRSDINQNHLNNPNGAFCDIDSALLYSPDNLPYLYKHARICDKYFRNTHLGVIKSDCERIIAIDTVPSPDSYRHFAFALLGRDGDAEFWLQKILEKNNENPEYLSVIYYNGACMYSLLNNTYAATLLLMDALEKGGFSCEQIKNDADFDNIRESPEFKSILKIACSDQDKE